MLVYAGQILEQSCLMFPLVLGLYFSFSILKIADLTVDGSMVLGAAVYAKLLSTGTHFLLALLSALILGGVAGLAVALVQRKNRIDPLIAGILMAFILNSLSLVVMQRPNIGLIGHDNPLASLPSLSFIIMLLVISAALFLRSQAGLWFKAFGNNQDLVANLGQDPERLRLAGLALANALAALCGCLTAQASGYADINMGFGQALIGIAMILVGRQLLQVFRKKNIAADLYSIFFTILGVVLYFILTNEIIRYGLSPVYLKMAIGGMLIIFLILARSEGHESYRA